MAEQVKIRANLLDTSTTQTADNWHNLLNLQTKMFLPHEIRFLLNSSIWLDAKSVLDIGCGNGAYISQISNYFPEKSYTGIDISPELIEIAQTQHTKNNVQFLHKNLQEFKPDQQFDLIIMRLIVQHLSDFATVLSMTSKLLKPGGALLIIEPDLENFCNRPETPKFENLMQSIDSHSAQQQTNRCILSELGHIAKTTGQWSIAQDIQTAVPFIGPFINSDLLRLYQYWIDILEQSHILSITLGNVRNELKIWADKPASYAQIGIRFLLLKAKVGTPY